MLVDMCIHVDTRIAFLLSLKMILLMLQCPSRKAMSFRLVQHWERLKCKDEDNGITDDGNDEWFENVEHGHKPYSYAG